MLDDLMARLDGVASRDLLVHELSRHVVDNAVRRRRLVSLLPGIVVDGWLVDDQSTRLRAAWLYIRGRGAVSHGAGLYLHSVIEELESATVTVPAGVRLRGADWLDVVEARGFHVGRPWTVRRRNIDVVALDRTLVAVWSQAGDSSEGRAPLITAVRERRVTVSQVRTVATSQPTLAGRRELLRLCDLMEQGAHSEFEIWGLTDFLDTDLIRRSRGQQPVRVGERTFYLDRGFDEEMVAAELDGTRWHDRHPEQRERDRRRDVALAAVGWLTVRLSYPRLMADPEGARRELLDVLATRRRQLGLPAA